MTSPRAWRYHLVGDTSDPDELRARARAGSGVVLVRSVPGSSVEEILARAGDWRDSDRLARIKYRGDVAWDVEIAPGEAREVARRWADIGRTERPGVIDERIPAELEGQLAGNDALFARRDELRDEHRLDDTRLARARTLLAGAGELAPAWLAGDGRVAVPVDQAVSLHDDAAIGRCHAAFLTAGEDEVWVVVPEPDATSRAMRFPDGVAAPNRPEWLRALGSLYLGQANRMLTGPALDAVLLDTDDYGLVAGQRSFVETVLGTDLAGAAERFRAYADGETYLQPRTDLTAVVDRYLGEAHR